MGTSAFNKYPSTHQFEGKKVLNIGCGYATYNAPNVVNMDAYGTPQVKWDLANPEPLPFPDNSFDFILANHILEHVPNWFHCFEECSRILKVGGHMEIWVPGPGSDSILGYRDHLNTINQCSWWGIRNFINQPGNAWCQAHKDGFAQDMYMVDMQVPLDSDLPWIHWTPKFIRPWIAKHLRNVTKEIGFFFIKLPPQNKPYFRNDTVEALI